MSRTVPTQQRMSQNIWHEARTVARRMINHMRHRDRRPPQLPRNFAQVAFTSLCHQRASFLAVLSS